MKNYEKYADAIRKYDANSFCSDFIKPNILKLEDCGGVACGKCHMLQMLWLLEEYEVDWSKVEVDTPILVKECEHGKWLKRYFAKYENGTVYAWNGGCTSFSESSWTGWKYAKLAESEEE